MRGFSLSISKVAQFLDNTKSIYSTSSILLRSFILPLLSLNIYLHYELLRWRPTKPHLLLRARQNGLLSTSLPAHSHANISQNIVPGVPRNNPSTPAVLDFSTSQPRSPELAFWTRTVFAAGVSTSWFPMVSTSGRSIIPPTVILSSQR